MPDADASTASSPDVRLPATAHEQAVIEALKHLGMGALAERMGIELLEVGPDRTVARMPVEGNTQPYGLLHGGASAVLAESIGSIASALYAGPGRISLGIELNCTHHKSMRSGYVVGTTTPLARSRSLTSYAIAVTTEDGTPVCSARLTCMLRDA
jgi:uncharacterized protein (TIGR00369 family)